MIYDVKTKNTSFLIVSKMLRDKGVKNNKFMLALYDESLVGVDPYSKNLTVDQQLNIYRECRRNKWYYIREIVRVPVDGLKSVSYEANLGNITLSYLKGKNKNIILLLPRQHGKTVGEIVDDTWVLNFAGTNSNFIYLNKDFTSSKKNLKIFKDIRLGLPDYILNIISDSNKDKDNEEYKLISKRNNTLRALGSANSKDQADKLGRGLTTSSIIFDEFAFLKFNDTIYLACLPAWSKAAENAKKNGVPYGITITTTPNNKDVPAGAFCYEMKESAAKFTLDCFDMSDADLNAYILNNSDNNYIAVQYSYLELGKNQEWLDTMVRNCNGDYSQVKREILLEWPKSMESSVFDEKQLENVDNYTRDPSTFLTVLSKYRINFFETPDFNKNYILSCDVAGGLSKDRSVINIIAPDDFRIVGEFWSAKIDTDNFRALIEELMTFYFRNSILIIERNSFGLNILQILMKNPSIEPRMYKEEKTRLGEKTTKNGFTVKKQTKEIIYGVNTDISSRKKMLELLPGIVTDEYEKIVSKELYKELVSLERKKNGKIEHCSNGHDDSIMAYLFFRYAVFYGTTFSKVYGISAIPSKSNIKTSSAEDVLAQVESILKHANDADTSRNIDSVAYSSLLDQSQKIAVSNASLTEEEREKKRKLDMFKHIWEMNE